MITLNSESKAIEIQGLYVSHVSNLIIITSKFLP